jgi:hypothetical protein
MTSSTRRRFLVAAQHSLLAAPLFAVTSAHAQPNGGPAAAGRLAPEEFGAVGDGKNNDSLAIQLSINALEKLGGGVLILANKTYRLERPLEIDPTKTSISGAHAVLDCRNMPPRSAAIIVRATAQSPVYDQGSQFVEGITIAGPGPDVDFTGIVLRTAAPERSSRIALRSLTIKDAAVGIDFGARTYLCQCFGVQIHGCGKGVVFTSNEDAGENISFYGCTIFNSQLAIENRSGAFANFFGCSFDYCRRWFVGSGLNQFSNCWFEKHRSEAAEEYPFELTEGELVMFGGGIQISGVDFAKGNQNRYMFMIRDRLAKVSLNGTMAWNWRTASDELAGGAGSIVVRDLGGSGKKIMPAILKNDQHHNVFGSAGEFEGSAIKVPCWIEGKGATRLGAHELEWRDGAAKSSVTLSSEIARSGRQSLKVVKGVGRGAEVSFNIAAPIAPGEGFSLRLWHRIRPTSADAIWFQIFFSQLMRFDEFNAPVFGNELFWGEAAVEPEGTNGEWRKLGFNSHNLDVSATALGYAPAWATHVRLAVNLVALAADAELWIDDLGGWRV